MLCIAEVNEINRFLELRHEWNKVLNRSRSDNVYLTWEFLSTYWKHFGKEKKLRILYTENKGKIIAIAPLRQSRYSFASPFSYDVIEPLAFRGLTPEGADYTGFILAERKEECLKLFLTYLVEHNDWDFIYLMDVPETSMNMNLLADITRGIHLTLYSEEGAVCPYMSVPNSLEAFLSKLSGKVRKNLRRCIKNLKSDYGTVELKRYDEYGSLEAAMKTFFELHQKRWSLRNMPGAFHSQEIRNFYIDVARLFANNGWLALYFLMADDKPIATQYCFEFGQKMYYALGGFDPDFADYSVGNLILIKIIEKCIEKGIREYDLLKGGEQYKFRYTTDYRKNLNIRLVNRKFTSHVFDWGMRTLKHSKADKLVERLLHPP
jgi:hypothetical protein